MPSEWIRMRGTLRENPKTIAIARNLCNLESFCEFAGIERSPSVHTVTFANVTRVTVCALMEVWFAINEGISEHDIVNNMDLESIDFICGIPQFGEAMLSVGWVEVVDSSSLRFPNFNQHNTPERKRSQPKTSAQRAKEYRERKKRDEAERSASRDAERSKVTNVTTYREEKRREESNTPCSPPARDGTGGGFEPVQTEFGVIEPDFPDWDTIQANLIAYWNELRGVTKVQSPVLGNKSLRTLQNRLLEQRGWDQEFVRATNKYPLKCGKKWKNLSSMILDDELIPGILSGNYDHEITNGKSERIRVEGEDIDDIPVTQL